MNSRCTKAADKKFIKIKGIEVESFKYCACVCDNLLPTINSWDLEKALKEKKLNDLFLQDKNLEILMNCLSGNFKIDEDYKFDTSNNSEFEQKIRMKVAVKKCVKGIINDTSNKAMFTLKMAEDYCACAMEKLFSSGFTYKEMLEIGNVNSTIFNEIGVPCFVGVVKNKPEFNSSNVYNINDIRGTSFKSLIPLIDYFGSVYKIKITISGITKYYLLDLGASDLIIDRETERELLLSGALKSENYLNKTEYILANNQSVKAQLVKVDNIKIGEYIVSNVVIGIIDDGNLLCGKSFLDKFKKWEIDKQNMVLILYR